MTAASPVAAAHRIGPAEVDDEAIAKGEALRQEALAAFDEGDLQLAVDKFKAAYEVDPSPAYLFNIGRVYEEMGELESALSFYERFSRLPRLELHEREQAAERIEVLRKLVDTSSPEESDPSGDTVDVVESDPQPRTSEDAGEARPSRGLVIADSALLGAGAAIAIGGGLGFGLAARNRSGRVGDITEGNNPDALTLAEVEDLDAEGRTFELYQIVTAVGGGTLAVAGGVLLGIGLARRAKAKPSLSFEPVVRRTMAGLVVRGRF